MKRYVWAAVFVAAVAIETGFRIRDHLAWRRAGREFIERELQYIRDNY